MVHINASETQVGVTVKGIEFDPWAVDSQSGECAPA